MYSQMRPHMSRGTAEPSQYTCISHLTAVTNWIPRFFNHLVEVLGRDEFAVYICLLLIDKVANKVVRKKPGEVANALSLPLTILQANSKAVPFKVYLLLRLWRSS